MGRTKKNAAEAPEAVQAEREPQEVSQGILGSEAVSGTAGCPQEGAVPQEVIGPESETELLGCQEEIPGDPPLEYAVTGCDLLNLRERPGLDARIITALPRGVGVSDTGQRQGDWWEVATGRLIGWVLSTYLEPVWS